MNAPSRDFVTVDMRGLKAALETRARQGRTSVSAIVRQAVADLLQPGVGCTQIDSEPGHVSAGGTVKVSIRLTADELNRLCAGAQSSGRSRGAYLAELVASVPAADHPDLRKQLIAALVSSCAEMSTLIRDVRHLTALLRDGAMRAAKEYQQRIETLEADVRRHLELASSALATLKSARRPSPSRMPTTTGSAA